jgi:TfoX/Sxy family transcriptional regulator of competence genes
MPKFQPASATMVALFQAVTADAPDLQTRKMFGYPCAFVRGQMLMGVFGDRLMLRLSEADRAKFLKLPGARLFEPMPGRPMREYVELPTDILNSTRKLRGWLRRGLAYVETLPPKAQPARRAKAPPR